MNNYPIKFQVNNKKNVGFPPLTLPMKNSFFVSLFFLFSF